jgi:hypothetical protein
VKKSLRWQFYAETTLSAITGIPFVVTLLNHAWIEVLFRIDPDQGQGWVEWLIVALLAMATLTCAALARSEWRRAAVAAT